MLGGVFEDCIFTANDMDRLKSFPSMEEARTELVGTINAPVTNLVGMQLLGSLKAGPQQVVRCLQKTNQDMIQLLNAHKDQVEVN